MADVSWLWSTLGHSAYLLLLFAPGGWIAFGLPLGLLPFWAKLCVSAMLSPVVVCLEFYVLRLAGATFEQTAILLVLVNLPALFLIWRRRAEFPRISRNRWMALAGALVFCAASLFTIIVYPERRPIGGGHAWTYADSAYAIARGDLIPDDSELAGFRMGYPVWGEGIYIAILCWLAETPPMYGYALAHFTWLVVVFALVAGVVRELGGGNLAQWVSGLWLFFGVNPFGDVLKLSVSGVQALSTLDIWTDPRYAPWVLKYYGRNTMPVVLGMFAALLYVLIRMQRQGRKAETVTVAALLLVGIGVLYPILFPAACGLIGAAAMVEIYETWKLRRRIVGAPILIWGGVLAVAAGVTVLELNFLVEGRAAGMPMHVSSLGGMLRKTLKSLIVFFPLLLGLMLVGRRCWNAHRCTTGLLLVGAFASAMLHIAFLLPYWNNEYKFIFTAAICLAPFACLATERVVARCGPLATALVLGGIAVVLVAPAAREMLDWGVPESGLKRPPAIDTSSFYLRLQPTEKFAGLCDAARERTPSNAVLVASKTDVHLPTLTARSQYVPPENRTFAGVDQGADALVTKIKGFSYEVLAQRRATLRQFYGDDDSAREKALEEILRLGRPVAVVVQDQAGLEKWLQLRGAVVYSHDRLSLWLIAP